MMAIYTFGMKIIKNGYKNNGYRTLHDMEWIALSYYRDAFLYVYYVSAKSSGVTRTTGKYQRDLCNQSRVKRYEARLSPRHKANTRSVKNFEPKDR
tara:strand:- start:592 stop:879 length:288 start_codon:yes stop_codon:yes gene_type:complete